MHKFQLKDSSYCCQMTETGIWVTDVGSILKHWDFK